MAFSKMLGLEVRPVSDQSSICRARLPSSRMSRVMLSSHRLWPSSCSFRVAFMKTPDTVPCLGYACTMPRFQWRGKRNVVIWDPLNKSARTSSGPMNKKKPAPCDAGFFDSMAMSLLDGGHGGSLRSLRTLGHLETDTLAFLETAESGVIDGRIVNEHVVPSILGRDETEALGIIEPFDCTKTHLKKPLT